MRQLRLADLVEFLEAPAMVEAVGRKPPAGPPYAQVPLRYVASSGVARNDDLACRPGESGNGEEPSRLPFQRPPCATADAILCWRIGSERVGGGTKQDRQVDDLGDRDDAAKPLDLLAEFMAERGDGRGPCSTGSDLPSRSDRHEHGRCPGHRRSRTGSPNDSGGCVSDSVDPEQGGADAPFGILLRES